MWFCSLRWNSLRSCVLQLGRYPNGQSDPGVPPRRDSNHSSERSPSILHSFANSLLFIICLVSTNWHQWPSCAAVKGGSWMTASPSFAQLNATEGSLTRNGTTERLFEVPSKQRIKAKHRPADGQGNNAKDSEISSQKQKCRRRTFSSPLNKVRSLRRQKKISSIVNS